MRLLGWKANLLIPGIFTAALYGWCKSAASDTPIKSGSQKSIEQLIPIPSLLDTLPQDSDLLAKSSIQNILDFANVQVLIQGLQAKVENFLLENDGDINAVFQKLRMKSEQDGLFFNNKFGKAQLIDVGKGQEVRIIMTVRLDAYDPQTGKAYVLDRNRPETQGHYLIFADQESLDPESLDRVIESENETERANNYEKAIRKAILHEIHRIARAKNFPTMLEKQRIQAERLQANQEVTSESVGSESGEDPQTQSGPQTSSAKNSTGAKDDKDTWVGHTRFRDYGTDFDGFHTTIIWHSVSKVLKIVNENRPKSLLSFDYWRHYWRAIYTKPHIRWDLLKEPGFLPKAKFFLKGDLLIMTLSTLGQVGLVYTSIGITNHANLTNENPHIIAASTTLFGIVFGLWSRTKSNWNAISANRFTLSQKTTSTGVGFGETVLLLKWLIEGASVSWMDHAKVLGSQVLKGPTKAGTQGFPMVRRKFGLNLGNWIFKIRIGGKTLLEYDTEIRRVEFEAQAWHLAQYPIRMLVLFLPPEIGFPLYMAMGTAFDLMLVRHIEQHAQSWEKEDQSDPSVERQTKVAKKMAEEYRAEFERKKLINWDHVQAAIQRAGDKIILLGIDADPSHSDPNYSPPKDLEKLFKIRREGFRILGQGLKDGSFIAIQTYRDFFYLDFLINTFPGYYWTPLSEKSWQYWKKFLSYSGNKVDASKRFLIDKSDKIKNTLLPRSVRGSRNPSLCVNL